MRRVVATMMTTSSRMLSTARVRGGTGGVDAVVSTARAEVTVLRAKQQEQQQQKLPFSVVHDPASAQELLDRHDAFIFDCDGVIWSGALGLIPGVAELLARLRSEGKRTLFVTNSSMRSRQSYARKFEALGLDVAPEQVVPSSYAAARWLQKNHPQVGAAYVIGESGLEEELVEAGIEVIRSAGPVRHGGPFPEAEFPSAEPDERIGAVVVGCDVEFNYSSIAAASLCLQRNGALFVATNDDPYDVVGGRRIPGNGVLVAAVQAIAGRPPDAVCGKPSADLARHIVADYGLDPRRTLMVGDRLDTDMKLAHAMGANSLLVFSGVTTADEVARTREGDDTCPTAVASHLGALAAAARSG